MWHRILQEARLVIPDVRRQHPERGNQDPLRLLLPHRPIPQPWWILRELN